VISDSELVRCEYIKNIQFNNISSKTSYFPFLMGRKGNYIEDIAFHHCRFDITEKADAGFMPRFVRNLKIDCSWNIE
jgi:hypothetical protein